jgi:glycosyltransferase involved in cell wall biosynthesis
MFVHVLDDRAVSWVVTTLSREMAARDVAVVIVCATSTPTGRARVSPNVTLEDLGVDPGRTTSYAVPRLVRWLRRQRPRVVFAHGEGPARAAVLATRLARVTSKVVAVEHTHTPTFRPQNRTRGAATRLLYRQAAMVAGVAPGVVEEVGRRVPAVRGRTTVLPSIGPDPASLVARTSSPPEHAWFEGSSHPFVIVSVANVVARKGQDVLVRALPGVRSAVGDARLLLIGRLDDAQYAEDLRRLAERLGVERQVCLAGYRQDPLPLVARSCVAALASHTEGFAMSLVEAMACGVPVVSSDCPVGPAYLLRNGEDGLLVPVGDPTTMAEAIIRIASDDALRAALIARGRARAAMFTPDAVASRYLDVVRQVAG